METICKCLVFLLVTSSSTICQKNKNKIQIPQKTEKLIGVWGKDLNENANFMIEKDSMYYFEDKYYKYTIKENPLGKDSIIIQFDGFKYRGVFWFRNDSLIIRDKISEHKFVRIK